MVARRTPRFPVLEPLTLPHLEPAGELVPGAREDHDGIAFSELDLGEGNLDGANFTECSFRGLTGDALSLRGSRFTETQFQGLNIPTIRGARVLLRDVELIGSRVGALDLHDGEVRSTLFAESKFGWAGFRAARLTRVIFRGCVFTELDLTGATLEGVSFEDCRTETLQVNAASLSSVDLRGLTILGTISDAKALRGATISSTQAASLTRVFAQHLGIAVDD
ncbi:uncharacterized low-complexity protein [Leucobacter sp. 7(1)]|uniref:pentapeptide repeat-containing protein n=1 Tax=Leucobacter sp. 7(1) TaxID=1255613 RepID=UPI00097EDE9C|nr:pentapeptide repeat-containing protein [Leucobacter sp. 7(1)]SJN08163.1 uncharacterized low-complexity protein [Leucobacter sp. 7(1)]